MRKLPLVLTTLLIGTMLFTSCDDGSRSRRRHSKGNESFSVIGELYDEADVMEITGADSLEEGRFFDNDCLTVRSNNKYNNTRIVLFDSEDEAEDYYSDVVNSYITNIEEAGSNYVIGPEYGVCDASFDIMILQDSNAVLITTVESSYYVETVEGGGVSTTINLTDEEVAEISEEWSS